MTQPIVRILAVSSSGPALTDPVDPRFGRAHGFVLVNLETGGLTYVDNAASQALSQGAGIQAAENLAKAGAEVLLTGQVGPKAWKALQAAGLKVVEGVEGMAVGEAIQRFRIGALALSNEPVRQEAP
jgi:predicted Fe-Mo cluster-binding NifX family protein